MITQDIIVGLMKTVQNLYLADDIPWVIGYSGGKDSTATLQLVWNSLKQLSKKQLHKTVHIINTDTLVESPKIERWAAKSLEMMQKAAMADGLPFETHRLTPDLDNTFWVNFLGKGYPFPRKKFRWCTDRLKIQPVNNFVKRKIAEHGEIILVLGTRKAESANRARTMAYYEKKRVRELLSPNPTMANELVFSPLEDWTDDDVWIYLMQYKNPWGYSNKDLLTLYRGATADGECPMMVQKDLPSCGKSRFGCWVCTVVEKDKSMEAMIANDDDNLWMTPLLEFRNEFGNEELDRERRSFRKMGGFLQGNNGRLNHGPYNKETREKWLRKLLEIQMYINKNAPDDYKDFELITIEELRFIRRIWVLNKHEFDDSLPRIYSEVLHKDFIDPEWIEYASFGAKEWAILQETCKDIAQDKELSFEMVANLIDIENRSNGMNKRSGLLKELEKSIRHTYYANEEDATNYYLNKMERNKRLGGKYDKNFLQSDEEENEEFVEKADE